jgi:hypothetical protein
MTDTHDSHVKDYYEYHAEQQRYFDDLAITQQPVDAGLDEYVALQQMEHLYQETGTWNADVWAEKGWW